MHHTGAALRRVAADMRARQPLIFSKEIDEKRAVLDIAGDFAAINVELNSGHSFPSQGTCCLREYADLMEAAMRFPYVQGIMVRAPMPPFWRIVSVQFEVKTRIDSLDLHFEREWQSGVAEIMVDRTCVFGSD